MQGTRNLKLCTTFISPERRTQTPWLRLRWPPMRWWIWSLRGVCNWRLVIRDSFDNMKCYWCLWCLNHFKNKQFGNLWIYRLLHYIIHKRHWIDYMMIREQKEQVIDKMISVRVFHKSPPPAKSLLAITIVLNFERIIIDL